MTDRQITHAPGCWDWGPRHYECALREIEQLRKLLDRMVVCNPDGSVGIRVTEDALNAAAELYRMRKCTAPCADGERAMTDRREEWVLVPKKPTLEMSRAVREETRFCDPVGIYKKMLAAAPTHPAITHCDNCGCDWLDNGLNPVGCPYCKQPAAVDEAVVEAVARAICVTCGENPDHQGDARGNEFRWQDYRDVALAAISAFTAAQQREIAAKQARSNALALEWWQDEMGSYEGEQQ